MSTVQIKLLAPVSITKPNASKNYQQMVVTHQEVGKDKPDGKKIFDFNTPKEVWETLKTAEIGATFEVERQKDKKEGKYWEWIAIRPVDASSPTAVASSPVAATPAQYSGTSSAGTTRVGNWETPEERAKKQVYIVRQSSLSNAIEYHKGEEATTDDIIQTARIFENYVFDNGVTGLTNDIPE